MIKSVGRQRRRSKATGKRWNAYAFALLDLRYRNRIVKSKKIYSRKGKGHGRTV